MCQAVRVKWLCTAAMCAIACGPGPVDPPRPSGAGQLTVVHHNKMGGSFVLETLQYRVDGRPVYDGVDPAVELPLIVVSEMLDAGPHDIEVIAQYRGNGHGVFSYLNKYRFTVKSEHKVDVVDRRHVELMVIAFEKGGVTTPLEQRPAFEFRAKER